MREVIGFNLICAAIAFVIVCFADLDTKEKVEFMACEICVMAVMSLGAGLLAVV